MLTATISPKMIKKCVLWNAIIISTIAFFAVALACMCDFPKGIIPLLILAPTVAIQLLVLLFLFGWFAANVLFAKEIILDRDGIVFYKVYVTIFKYEYHEVRLKWSDSFYRLVLWMPGFGWLNTIFPAKNILNPIILPGKQILENGDELETYIRINVPKNKKMCELLWRIYVRTTHKSTVAVQPVSHDLKTSISDADSEGNGLKSENQESAGTSAEK